MAKKGQHVVPNGGKWSVRKAGSSRASGTYETQKEAITAATKIAKNQKTELYIHREDGRIRDRNSYGNDPKRQKGQYYLPNDFENNVFINCPFDEEYAPLLDLILFCIVYAGLSPRLSSERLEAGESRLNKIIELIAECKYSIHDLSISKATEVDELFRMNMPFELGLDMGFRMAPDKATNNKKFLIFEKNRYDLKRTLSDLAGMDVAFHNDDIQKIIKKVRDFLSVEAGRHLPGATQIEWNYFTFLGWMMEKKIFEGHTEDEAKDLPTQEILDEMKIWVNSGKPEKFP